MDLIAYGLKHKIITEEQAKKAQKLRTYSQEAFFQYLKQFNFLPLIQEEDFNLKQKTEFTPPVENKVATQTHQLLPICWKLLEKGVVSTTELNQEICALNLTEREPKNLLQNLLKKKRIEGEQFVTLYKAMNKEAKPLEGYKVTLQEDGTPIFSQSLIEEFGHFKIVAQLGQGGMGTVLQAIDHLERTVALKKISSTGNTSETSKKRFFNEAKVMGNLEHPNIVKVYDFGTIENTDYISMEFVAGHTLDQYLAKRKLELRDKVELLKQISEALSYLHENNVLHRDLKPLNIMVNQQKQIKIMDFGLAKKQEQQLTKTGVLIGTPNYMSPEQIDSKRFGSPSFQSDIFSLGVIIYEVLTASLPFTGNTLLEILRGIIGKDPFPLEKYEANIPQELSLICLKCLEKNSKTRYLSMKEVTDELELWLKGYPIKTRPYNLLERLIKWGKRNRLSVAAVSFTVLLLLIISLFQWWKQTRSTNELLKNASQHVSKKEYEKAINLYAKTWDLAPTQTSSALSLLLHQISPKKEPTSEDLNMFAQNFNIARRVFLLSPKEKQFIKFKFEVGKSVILSAIAGGDFRFARFIFRELDALDITQKKRAKLSNQIEEAATAEKRRQLTRLDYWVNKIEKGLIQENEFQLAVNEITKFDEPEILEQLLNYFQDAVKYYSNETKQYSIEKEQLYNVILKTLSNITPNEKESLKVSRKLVEGLKKILLGKIQNNSISESQQEYCGKIVDILKQQVNYSLLKEIYLLQEELLQRKISNKDEVIGKLGEVINNRIINLDLSKFESYEDLKIVASFSSFEKKLELLEKASKLRPQDWNAQLSYLRVLFQSGKKEEAYNKLMLLQKNFKNVIELQITEIIFLRYMQKIEKALSKTYLLIREDKVSEESLSEIFSYYSDGIKNHREILKIINQYIKNYPKREELLLESRAKIYIIQERYNEAIIDLEKKLKSGVKNPTTFEMLIRCYLNKKGKKAEAMVEEALLLYPKRYKLYYYYSILMDRKGLFAKAKFNYNRALNLLDIEINNFHRYKGIKYSYQKRNHYYYDREFQEKLLLIEKVKIQFALRKYKESFLIMSNMLEKGNDILVAINYAYSAFLYSESVSQDSNERKKIKQKALKVLESLNVKRNEVIPEFYVIQIKIYLSLGKFNEAQYLLPKLEKLAPSKTEIYLFKGRLYFKKKNYQKSIDAYNLRLFTNPNDVHSWGQKAIAHHSLRQDEKTIEVLERTFELDKKFQVLDKIPKSKSLLLRILAECKLSKKQLNEAIFLANDSLKYNPKNYKSHRLLIDMYYELNEIGNLLLLLNDSIKHNPEFSPFYFERAKCNYYFKRYSEGLKDDQKVLELSKLYPENKIPDEYVLVSKKRIQQAQKKIKEAAEKEVKGNQKPQKEVK